MEYIPELFVAICDEGLISMIVTIIVIVRYEKSHVRTVEFVELVRWVAEFSNCEQWTQCDKTSPNKEFVVGICWVYRYKM